MGGGGAGEFQSQGAVQLNTLAPLVLRREMGTDRRPAQHRERKGLGQVGVGGGAGAAKQWSSARMRVVGSDHLGHVSILAAGSLKGLKHAVCKISSQRRLEMLLRWKTSELHNFAPNWNSEKLKRSNNNEKYSTERAAVSEMDKQAPLFLDQH